MATLATKLTAANESTWIRLGALAEMMHDADKAMYSYENVLRHNPVNVKALTQIASICRLREQYPKAVEFFQRILNIENNNGEIWGALGHCYLMMDDLQKAYTAYQQALYHLPNPKDPNLWYGIGILYDRYGSFEHAEEAFTAVLKMDPKFEKSNEIYFRLGIIYKQQMKYEQALECFRFILQKPPRPLTQGDIYFQIGHVYELQKEFNSAKEAYERVLKESPNHAKALQQLGWLYHSNSGQGHQDVAINYLMRSIDADANDGQTWYLLGRCYMAQQQYRKAYDAYQQAVYRDGRNPTFWCSIGVLYYQINQYRDALDAYSRAIRLNPYLSEVWYDLGTLYESCNQISDSLDAYQRAAELDPGNKHIQQRLQALRDAQSNPNKAIISQESDKNKLNSNSDQKAPILTLEPKASERPRSPRLMPQNIPQVADLVDLSNTADEKRTLPSTNDLNNLRSGNGTPSVAVKEERSILNPPASQKGDRNILNSPETARKEDPKKEEIPTETMSEKPKTSTPSPKSPEPKLHEGPKKRSHSEVEKNEETDKKSKRKKDSDSEEEEEISDDEYDDDDSDSDADEPSKDKKKRDKKYS